MATVSGSSETISNIISGKVLHKELGKGVPNLLIVLFDIDHNLDPEEYDGPVVKKTVDGLNAAIGVNSTPFPDISSLYQYGDRIGSTLTNASGEFSFEVAPKDFNLPPKKIESKSDLVLVVLAPEEPGLDLNSRLLYLSNDIRWNAGTREAFVIRLSNDLLIKSGITVEQTEPVSNKINSYLNTLDDEKKFNRAVFEVAKENIKAKQADLAAYKAQFTEILSPVPLIPVDSTFSTFVKQDEKVFNKLEQHFVNEIDKANSEIGKHILKNKGLEVTFVLNQADKTKLAIELSSPETKHFVDAENNEPLKSVLNKMNSAGGNNLILTSDNPILKKCLSKSEDVTCATTELGLTSTSEHNHQANRVAIQFSELPQAAKNVINGNYGGEANTIAVVKITEPEQKDRFEVRLLTNITLHFDSEGFNTDNETSPLSPEEIANYVKKVITGIRSIKSSVNIATTKPNQDAVNQNIDNFSLKKGPAELPAFHDFQVLNIAFSHIWQQLVDDNPAQLAAEAKSNAENRGYNLANRYTSVSHVLSDLYLIERTFSPPPQSVISNFDITFEEWNALEPDAQNRLNGLSQNIDIGLYSGKIVQSLKEQGELLIDYVRNSSSRTFHKILTELDNALKSNYAFNIFGADETAKAINFGLLNTYRQKWEPVAYQVGDLVKSIPLSPKEERKYSLKTTFNRKRTEKESKKNSSSLTQEQNTTSRAEEEIVSKAQSKNNFNLAAEAEFSKWKVSSSIGLEASKESSENKKDFRESVLKATQEFKEERSVEIDTEESYSTEYNESGTIVNPNDELAVTYLFYELQKRYKVSEQLYRVMPVVLVAQDVPAPNEITETWIIAHDWILNRAILDDSFRPALQYIAQKNVGDDYAIRELRKNLRTQRNLVETLKRELATLNTEAENRYVALEEAINKRIWEEHDANSDGILTDIGEWFRSKSKEDPEAAKAREMAARDAQGYAVEKAQKMAMNLQREVNSLQSLTADYTKVMREHLDKKTMVERLLLHIKNNIIYYMQAIWSMEPPDQRYMRLLNVKVPQFEIDSLTCDIQQQPENDLFKYFRKPDETLHKAWLQPTIKKGEDKALVEMADLDNFLGFKGNYMVFRMKLHNALTSLMAMPYIDASFGAMDPDQLSNISLEDYARYVCCLREELGEEEFNKPELIATLKNWLKLLLEDPLRNGDEIIVPTNSLYIEMLLSANSLLEDFKLQHREWDVYKVQEEVQMQALENLRIAKRILEDKLEDPKIDKKIVVEGKIKPSIDVDTN